MNGERFEEVFRQFEECMNGVWRRLTGQPMRPASARRGGMVGSSRQRSLLAYEEFMQSSARQMRDFLRRNRNWHH